GLETDFERLWEQVRQIRCPALLVRGAKSAILTPEAAARFVRELPGCALAEVPGAGHSVMGDNPSGFLAAVRPFLLRHRLSPHRPERRFGSGLRLGSPLAHTRGP